MEEETQSVQTLQKIEENGGDDDFYEKIEAPKFVDLNAPDRYHPGDDRYWFCSRVGCDQKHEEEMDSEVIYKNFVLRVMAARSPNIRLRKALFRKESSNTPIKCPQTVPAKPSKSRVAKLALISSISKRIVDPKVKVKPSTKQRETPNLKGKQSSTVLAKALTTPRNKKRLSNPNAFRSVRHPKATAIAVPKNRAIARTLVFPSPKKKKTRTSLELNTPVKTLCEAMKKLDINTGKKQVLGYNRQLLSDVPRKQLRGREVKSRVYDGLRNQNPKGPDETSKCLKKKNMEKNLQPQNHDPQPREEIENHPGKMEVEESGNGSLNLSSTSKVDCGQGQDVPLANEEVTRQSGADSKAEVSSDAGRSGSYSLSFSKERSSKENSEFEAPKGGELNKSNGQEELTKPDSDNCTDDVAEIDDKTLPLHSESNGNDIEVLESDDKENAAASDENNRGMSQNNSNIERKILGKHETAKGLKTARATRKDATINAATPAEGLKHIKPKPTNPKPFRLRTDERRILKEANLEKKLDVAPLKETTSVSKFPGGRSLKKDQNHNKKSVHQTQYSNNNDEKNEERNRQQRDQLTCSSLKNSKQRVRQRSSSLTPQRHTVSSQRKLVAPKYKHNEEKASQKLGNLRRTKSLSVRQLGRSQGIRPSMKETIDMVTPCQLSVIRESSPRHLVSNESTKLSENCTQPLSKASASASRQLSVHEKRFTTIPKEPNFHTIHVPKSCTKRALGHC